MENKGKNNYISGKELRRISKENAKMMRSIEKRKYRKNVDESEYLTKMRDDRNIIEFDNLHTYFFTDSGVSKAVNGVSFDVPAGSTVGIVGESGCGKSVTSLSLMQLVQAPTGQIVEGSIRFKLTDFVRDEKGNFEPIFEYDENGAIKTEPVLKSNGETKTDKYGSIVYQNVQAKDKDGFPAFEMVDKTFDIAKMPVSHMWKVRGKEIAMIFQEPMTSLNPVFTVGYQIDEVVLLHTPGATKQMAKAQTIKMLETVGIAMPEHVYKSYPHELSGGMRQRVMIAMALSCNPKVIIADEPTTALDVTIQAQILELLREIKHKTQSSILLITHDLGVIAEMADYVVIMYAGRVIEKGTVLEIYDNPKHPYTIGLQKSKPVVGKKVDELFSISGRVPSPIDMPDYCYFRDRCDRVCDFCAGDYPEMIKISDTHSVACHLYSEKNKK